MPDGASPRFAFVPAAMNAEAAAFYLGMGEHAFLQRVAAGKAPQPIRDGRQVIWLREDLDLYLGVLAGTRPAVNWLDGRAGWRQAAGEQATGW